MSDFKAGTSLILSLLERAWESQSPASHYMSDFLCVLAQAVLIFLLSFFTC